MIYIIENFGVANAKIFIHSIRSFSIRFKRDLNPLWMLSVTMHVSHSRKEPCKRTSLIIKVWKEQPRASSQLLLKGYSCLQWEQTGLYQSTELQLMNSTKALPGHWIHSNFFTNLKSQLYPFLLFSVPHLTLSRHNFVTFRSCIRRILGLKVFFCFRLFALFQFLQDFF